MTIKELLKMLFPEVSKNISSCAFLKCNAVCETCNYHNYWNQPAVIDKTVAKNILNSAYGVYSYFDTDSTYMVYSARGTGKTYAQELHLIKEGWSKFPSFLNNIEWSMLKDIIDDALDNGFEVTILNGTIYYREKQ